MVSAVRVEHVGKQYRIGGKPRGYRTVRETVMDLFSGRRPQQDDSAFWALDDVSFDVDQGDVVGIIGGNGAGKSTLLKILSRITEPTKGELLLRGRVGSLLEVGTGFHPELSGRENIFLSGAILGMPKSEITRRFDEMVDFAGVAKFIDTPVKRYSTGMHLRLAFSVAAHLEPEVLLVDEVLAVGDIAFQKKCIGKMEDVAGHGRTVLFVSHNLAAVRGLCKSTLVLEAGRVVYRGNVAEGITHYSRSVVRSDARDQAATRWRNVTVNGELASSAREVDPGQPLTLEAVLELRDAVKDGLLFCIVEDSTGDMILHQAAPWASLWPNAETLPAGQYKMTAELPALWLSSGVYSVHFKLYAYSTTGGATLRALSDRGIIDVGGYDRQSQGAKLSPPLGLRLTPEASLDSGA